MFTNNKFRKGLRLRESAFTFELPLAEACVLKSQGSLLLRSLLFFFFLNNFYKKYKNV